MLMQQIHNRVRSRIDGRPVHPGRILFESWMHPLDLSQNELARIMGVSARRVNEIVHGRRAITADSAVRLAKATGMTAHYWLALQSDYEIELVLARGGAPRHVAPRTPPLTEDEKLHKSHDARMLAMQTPEFRDMVEWPRIGDETEVPEEGHSPLR
jgi:addiction module HigA family antidote